MHICLLDYQKAGNWTRMMYTAGSRNTAGFNTDIELGYYWPTDTGSPENHRQAYYIYHNCMVEQKQRREEVGEAC